MNVTIAATLIALAGTLVGSLLGWFLARRTAVREERRRRLSEDLIHLRTSLERYIAVLDKDRWWEGYEPVWFDVVLAIGRLDKHQGNIRGRNLDILRSIPGRELESGAPERLKEIARESIRTIEASIP